MPKFNTIYIGNLGVNKLLFFCIFVLLAKFTNGQVNPPIIIKNQGFYINPNVGFDIPSYTKAYKFYELKGGLKFGLDLGYNFANGLGIGVDYDYITNNPNTNLKSIYYDSTTAAVPTLINKNKLVRHFIGIGPNYTYYIGSSLALRLYGRGGYGLLSGGEMLVSSKNPTTSVDEYHLFFNGFDSKQIAFKMGGKVLVKITENIRLQLGAYHMRYFSVTPDDNLTLNGIGKSGYFYGASPLIDYKDGQFLQKDNANVIKEATCSACSSTGIDLGFVFTFGRRDKTETGCKDCECPNDGHKVVVTVLDGPSQKVIPGADVAIKDLNGNIIATGTTNSFGAVDFGQIKHGNYSINGKVYDIETSVSSITEDEFKPNAIIQKVLLYEDLRFILKGKVINKKTQQPEPNVVVNLTNLSTRNVAQDNSDGAGEFTFRLDKESSYEVVGIKENKLSDIDRASTVGLTRSTTLFVELKLGVDNFDCGMGTVLDIKYDYDKWEILPESKFELDRLVRYMNDHQVSRVELASHTDSRGKNEYNESLSQKRAQSAVSYITSRGINSNRIIAHGYGERILLNDCRDGVNCSEDEHRKNRRTEAKLLCN